MEKEFCTYTQALRLKAIGFDEPCFGYYVLERNGDYKLYDKCEVKTYFTYIEAPTFSQVFRWFREKHKLYVNIESQKNEMGFWGYVTNSTDYLHDVEVKIYEEAELACLEKLLEIVESKSE